MATMTLTFDLAGLRYRTHSYMLALLRVGHFHFWGLALLRVAHPPSISAGHFQEDFPQPFSSHFLPYIFKRIFPIHFHEDFSHTFSSHFFLYIMPYIFPHSGTCIDVEGYGTCQHLPYMFWGFTDFGLFEGSLMYPFSSPHSMYPFHWPSQQTDVTHPFLPCIHFPIVGARTRPFPYYDRTQ